MFVEADSVKPNSFCWQGIDYCGKCSFAHIHKTKHRRELHFLLCFDPSLSLFSLPFPSQMAHLRQSGMQHDHGIQCLSNVLYPLRKYTST